MSRLVQKIAVRALTLHELPEHIAATVQQGAPIYYLFGLKWSGQAVLDELHLARVLLYAKIYRHQKVLAIEGMVQALLEALGTIEGIDTVKLVALSYYFSDDQLLWCEPEVLVRKLGLTPNVGPALKFVGETLASLRDRRVYVNALSLRPLYPGDPWEHNKEQVKGLRHLDEALKHPQKSTKFRSALIAEMRRIVSLAPEAAGSFDTDLLDYSVVVSAKPPLSGGTEIDRAFIFQGDKNLQYRDITGVNRSGWVDAYSFSSTSVFIFAPRELTSVAYIAAETVIRREYNAILPSAAMELSKQNPELVASLKKSLESKGYYKGIPYDILPVPERLTKADVPMVIKSICDKLEVIDEPPHEPEARRPALLSDRIKLWLSQFRSDDHIQYAIDLLRAIRVLSRDDTSRALHAFLNKNPEFKGATVVLLGGVKDSSSIQGYYSKDVPDAFRDVTTLEEVCRREVDAPVVFLDDFVGSGGQVKDILGNWFGVDELKNEGMGEQRELFGEKEREYLKSRKVGLVFVAGWLEGKAAVEKACATVGLDATVHVEITDEQIPFAFENVLSAPASKVEAFKTECARIGLSLLESSGKSGEKVATRNLGYGNRAMLLVSRYNVPTQVLTCLWHEGQVDGVDWYPLMKRRSKQ